MTPLVFDADARKLMFSQHIPGLQIAWDASSISVLMACPRKYFYSIMQGWQKKMAAVALDFGTFYHGAVEVYDKALIAGDPFELALDKALTHALVISTPRPRPLGCRRGKPRA